MPKDLLLAKKNHLKTKCKINGKLFPIFKSNQFEKKCFKNVQILSFFLKIVRLFCYVLCYFKLREKEKKLLRKKKDRENAF